MAETLGPILAQFERRSLASFRDAKEMWEFALAHVNRHRRGELDRFWEDVLRMSSKDLAEHDFLREYAWCVYVSGFSASTIAKKFDRLLVAHRIEDQDGNYLPITEDSLPNRTWDRTSPVFRDVLAIFGNFRKANAVQVIRDRIFRRGWEHFDFLRDKEPESFRKLPMIGPALSRHLARNLGNKDVAKPDVHLKRLADKYGAPSVDDMLRALSDQPIGWSDLVLWLASVDHGTRSEE